MRGHHDHKPLPVPFYRQKMDHTCGPRALQMVLAYYGKRPQLRVLLKACRTRKRTGTERENLVSAATSFGFEVSAKSGSKLSELCRTVRNGTPVIVNYRHIPSEGHYAVVTGCNKTHVIMNDPWYGKGFRISKKGFLKRWHGYHVTQHARWMMIVRRTGNP